MKGYDKFFNDYCEENDWSPNSEEAWRAATERALRAVEKTAKIDIHNHRWQDACKEVRRLIEEDENL